MLSLNLQSIESGIAIAAVLKRIATVPSDSNPSVLEETDEEFLSRGQVPLCCL